MDLLIFGLGNPGSKFVLTRHNVGFALLDKIVIKNNLFLRGEKNYEYSDFKSISGRIVLIKPLTYMNLSGSLFPSIFTHFNMNIKNLLVILDNVGLPLGKCRLKGKGGLYIHHNGLKSISNSLGSSKYNRLYIGVGDNKKHDLRKFVLSSFCKQEKERLENLYDFLSDEIIDIDEDNLKAKIQKINSSNF